MISVLVADRHPLFREGLARVVRQRATLQLVGEVADGRAALDRILRHRPDVAILDADPVSYTHLTLPTILLV